MTAARLLEPLPVPTGAALEEILPRLAAALSGAGPALLPLPATDPPTDRAPDPPADRATDPATGRATDPPTHRTTNPATARPDGRPEDRGAAWAIDRIAADLGAGRPLDPAEDDEDDPTAVVIATSGSTGRPKGALLSASALAASAAATHARLGGPGRWLLALPAQHIAGLQVLLRSVAAGTSPDILDTAVPFTAERFTAAVAAMGSPSAAAPRRYVSLVPTQLHRVLIDPEAAAAATEFDAVLVGGSATSPTLLERARAAGIAVVTTYGMSETCGGCVYDGYPLDGVRVDTDADGRISLSGPMVARGYRGRPGDPAFPAPGTFRTEDWGTIDATDGGRLSVLGRLDDVIVTGGIKVPPGVVEARLASLPGVAHALVVGVPDPEWGQAVAAVITADGEPPALETIRARLADLPPGYRPRRLVVVDEIPLLGLGKPDRTAARRLLQEATRRPAATLAPDDSG